MLSSDTFPPIAGASARDASARDAAAVLAVRATRRFDPAIAALRASDYDPAAGAVSIGDAFDAHSVHITVHAGGRLVGAVRVTQPSGVLRSWATRPEALGLPQGAGVAELSRGVVARDWRGRGIYQLFMAHATLLAARQARTAICTVEDGLPVRTVLHGLGFRERGPVMPYHHDEGCSTLAQGMSADLAAAQPLAQARLDAARARLRMQGFTLDDDLASVALPDPAAAAPARLTRPLRWFGAHLRDCLAIALVATPLFAWLEVHWLGVSVATSLRVRLMTIAVLVAGLGLLLARGRDLSQRLLRIRPGVTPERTVLLHDMAYQAAANGVLAPLFYLAAGASTAAAVKGSLMAVVLALATGSLNGWSIDTLRELTGVPRSERLPAGLRQGPAGARAATFLALVTLSLMLVWSAYRPGLAP